jgi:hypothetical protein
MAKLEKGIDKLIEQEQLRAARRFGKYNNGRHESYAVILEEFEEAEDCRATFCDHLKCYWNFIKKNNSEANHELNIMRQFAERAAVEWVQVAAMCKKAQDTEQEHNSVKYQFEQCAKSVTEGLRAAIQATDNYDRAERELNTDHYTIYEIYGKCHIWIGCDPFQSTGAVTMSLNI